MAERENAVLNAENEDKSRLPGNTAGMQDGAEDVENAAGPVAEGDASTQAVEEPEHSNLPRPIAVLFAIILFPLSFAGITILTAGAFIITAAVTLLSLGLVVGGIYLVIEGILNVSSAHYIAFELMGIGLAAAALGLVLFTIALRCITRLLPRTAGLYRKAARAIKRL